MQGSFLGLDLQISHPRELRACKRKVMSQRFQRCKSDTFIERARGALFFQSM